MEVDALAQLLALDAQQHDAHGVEGQLLLPNGAQVELPDAEAVEKDQRIGGAHASPTPCFEGSFPPGRGVRKTGARFFSLRLILPTDRAG